MLIAIHTVFILKENILFLEDWIDYHIKLGFNRFYLYDNSKVINGGHHTKSKPFIPGKRNKYNINYNNIVRLSDKEMYNILQNICNKYKCINIIEWSPKDINGNVAYNQYEAHDHCLERLKKNNIN